MQTGPIPGRVLAATIALALFAIAAPVLTRSQSPSRPFRLRSPAPWRVYQRGADGRAKIALEPEDPAHQDLTLETQVIQADAGGDAATQRVEGRVIELPTGGPYTLVVRARDADGKDVEGGEQRIGPVFVGDLWVLAGQSNMEGYGNLRDLAPPSPDVAVLGMDGAWKQAEEPLHWLVDSPDPVHSGDPATRPERARAARNGRGKGAGLGLPFGAALAEATGVPIGLVPVAHGGTSMAQWDPAKKNQGGESLYGSMIRQFELAGGAVKGVLWYQGESDAIGSAETAEAYADTFAAFIRAVRDDLGRSDLPFLYVQIGRFIRQGDPRGWNLVQDAQRLLPERVPHTGVVASIDLELDDLIHIGTDGLKRLGLRLARLAEREVYGRAGATTPTFEGVAKAPGGLLVRFRGVNTAEGPRGAGLLPLRRVAGFSIRKADGTEIPLIHEASVAEGGEAVLLELIGPIPPGARLWYGYGLDPYCNLADGLDMAVPVFGPIPLDAVH